MGLKKYRYYFRKPRSEIVKDILSMLFTTGVLIVASNSPYFVTNLWKNLGKRARKYPKKKFSSTFYYLRSRGYLDVKKENHQIYINLTKEGKKKVGRFQIDSLEIKRPRKWDRKWRLVVFDISELKKTQREAFRGKLKQLGFYPLQKSVWLHPFDCEAEIDLLGEFFGLDCNELRLVVAESIGRVDDFKDIFKL